MSLSAALYVVPVPVGNMDDITIRAVKVLRDVDVIYCEDTRATGSLLSRLGIVGPRLRSNHTVNEATMCREIVTVVKSGKAVALVSDAGTPGISDPGFVAIRHAAENDIQIIALPGPTALIPALVAAALPCDKFFFGGFPPHRKGRKEFIATLTQRRETMVLYESPHRIITLLEQLENAGLENRDAAIVRELSKLHEEVIRGTIHTIHQQLKARKTMKGEFVLIIAGIRGVE